MSVTTGALTYEDLCRAREDGNRYELIEGELVLVGAPSPLHQRLLLWLGVTFVGQVTDAGRGEVYIAPVDVRLADGSYVQPDVLVVLTDRSTIVGEALIEGEPSLVVEILSPSSKARDRVRKAALYARVGVPEYWIFDAEDRSVTLHAGPSDDGYRAVRRVTGIVESVTIPGLAVDLDAFFAREQVRP